LFSLIGAYTGLGSLLIGYLIAFIFIIGLIFLVWRYVKNNPILWHPPQPPKQYGIPSQTITGVNVRSRGEKQIADYFTAHQTYYEYEKPIKAGFFGSTTLGHPDFYLPEYNVYVEYWGLVHADDEQKSRNYRRAMRRKKQAYERNGIKLISLYPENLNSLDYYFRRRFRDATGYDFPR